MKIIMKYIGGHEQTVKKVVEVYSYVSAEEKDRHIQEKEKDGYEVCVNLNTVKDIWASYEKYTVLARTQSTHNGANV